jgi:hypothetical protein
VKKERRVPRRPKKFRSQIVSKWLLETFEPCKAADVGGGKGLLCYLLQQSGWDATVIDPEYQDLPLKYTSLEKKRIKISPDATVPHITAPFEEEMTKDFNLLIGLHVHGSCMKIIKSCAEYKKDFVLLPCCVIDEPIDKQPNINWRESLIEYAQSLGLDVKTVKFGFMGKDIAIYTDSYLPRCSVEIVQKINAAG